VTVAWEELAARGRDRYEDGARRLPDDPEARQKQLVRMGAAAGAVGLAHLMDGRDDEARDWLRRSAERHRESYAGAPPGSWGRPIGAIKARLLAGDTEGAVADARWALDEAGAGAESPIGRYAEVLALLVLGRDTEAVPVAHALSAADDFPPDVAAALAALAEHDAEGYGSAVRDVLASFEARDEYLEGVPAADTVLVLQALAVPRGLAVPLSSPLLPP
jgi:hypothetical protein